MKLGPLHVVTDRTMAVMQRMIGDLAKSLDEAHYDRHRLASQLTSPKLPPDVANHLHCPADARLAPTFIFEPDADNDPSRQAVSRVVRAYRLAMKEHVPAARGLWDVLEQRNDGFVRALNRGDEDVVGGYLRRMFATDLTWGLGYVAEAVAVSLRDQPEGNVYQLRVTDLLVALAEAVGASWVTNVEQGLDKHIRALDVDLAEILRGVERMTGLDLRVPEVGAGYGCVIDGKKIAPDTIVHSYSVYRLRELGVSSLDRIAEIGGGFGCLAMLMFRAGFANYTIYDLPWVNALQGYFLIMSLPEGSIRLYGETEGTLAVEPGWCFAEQDDRSADWVINTNSLPEMGADTARDYVKSIRRVAKQGFFSINMEAKPMVYGYGEQNCVPELVAEVGGLRRISRNRYWMRRGYVEEVYRVQESL